MCSIAMTRGEQNINITFPNNNNIFIDDRGSFFLQIVG